MKDKNLNDMREIMNRYDLMGIYLGENANFDEYDPEIKEILKLNYNKINFEDFKTNVFLIFKKMFESSQINEDSLFSLSKELYSYLNNLSKLK